MDSTEVTAMAVDDAPNGDISNDQEMVQVADSAGIEAEGAAVADFKNDGTQIYVGNVAKNTPVDSIKELFEPYGTISSCHLRRYYGFVHMDSQENAQKAIEELNGKEINGKLLVVKLARDRKCALCGSTEHLKRKCPDLPPSERKSDQEGDDEKPKKTWKPNFQPKTPLQLLNELVPKDKLEYTFVSPEITAPGAMHTCKVKALDKTFEAEGITKKEAKNIAADHAVQSFISSKDNEFWEKIARRASGVPPDEPFDGKVEDEAILKIIKVVEGGVMPSLLPVKPETTTTKATTTTTTTTSPAKPEVKREGIKIYVGNLAPNTKHEDVQSAFQKYGQVNGRCFFRKYYAFVYMQNEEEAQKAIEDLNGSELNGQAIVVDLATKKEATPTDKCNRCEKLGHFSKDCPDNPKKNAKRENDGDEVAKPKKMRKLKIEPKLPLQVLNESVTKDKLEYSQVSIVGRLSSPFGQVHTYQVKVFDQVFQGIGSSKKEAKNIAAYLALLSFIYKKNNEIWDKLSRRVPMDSPDGKVEPADVLKLLKMEDPAMELKSAGSDLRPHDPMSMLRKLKFKTDFNEKGQEGLIHQPTFCIEIVVDEDKFMGKGRSKKEARADAARNSLRLQIAEKKGKIYDRLVRMVTGTPVGEVQPVHEKLLLSLIKAPPVKEVKPDATSPTGGAATGPAKPKVNRVDKNSIIQRVKLGKWAELNPSSPITFLKHLKSTVKFEDKGQEGPSHVPVFTVEVKVNGTVYTGKGKSKKEARSEAASNALRREVLNRKSDIYQKLWQMDQQAKMAKTRPKFFGGFGPPRPGRFGFQDFLRSQPWPGASSGGASFAAENLFRLYLQSQMGGPGRGRGWTGSSRGMPSSRGPLRGKANGAAGAKSWADYKKPMQGSPSMFGNKWQDSGMMSGSRRSAFGRGFGSPDYLGDEGRSFADDEFGRLQDDLFENQAGFGGLGRMGRGTSMVNSSSLRGVSGRMGGGLGFRGRQNMHGGRQALSPKKRNGTVRKRKMQENSGTEQTFWDNGGEAAGGEMAHDFQNEDFSNFSDNKMSFGGSSQIQNQSSMDMRPMGATGANSKVGKYDGGGASMRTGYGASDRYNYSNNQSMGGTGGDSYGYDYNSFESGGSMGNY